MCPFKANCQGYSVPELCEKRYPACARYILGLEIGIDCVPANMKPIDYALISSAIAYQDERKVQQIIR